MNRLRGKALRALGYSPGAHGKWEQSWRFPGVALEPRSLMLVHAADPWNIDLHNSLDRRYAAGSPLIPLNSIVEARPLEPWALSNRANVLPPSALVLHLACHASAGLVGAGCRVHARGTRSISGAVSIHRAKFPGATSTVPRADPVAHSSAATHVGVRPDVSKEREREPGTLRARAILRRVSM